LKLPGMRGRKDKGERWRGEFNYDTFVIRSFVNATMYPSQYNN
jgi:hypothetical protein